MTTAILIGALLTKDALLSFERTVEDLALEDRPYLLISPAGEVLKQNDNAKIPPGAARLINMRVARAEILSVQQSRAVRNFINTKGFPCIVRSRAKNYVFRTYQVQHQGRKGFTFSVIALDADLPLLMQDMTKLNQLQHAAAIRHKQTHSTLSLSHSALRETAERDHLTTLFNRHAATRLYDEMLFSIEKYNRTRGKKRYLVSIITDVDLLKNVNDTYGHDAGDAALQHVANVLLSCKRASDALIRWGGEEMLLLAIIKSRNDAARMAERFRKTLMETPFRYHNEDVLLTASFGVTIIDPDEVKPSLKELVRAADKGLYKAKGAGRNQVVLSPFGRIGAPSHPADDAEKTEATFALKVG